MRTSSSEVLTGIYKRATTSGNSRRPIASALMSPSTMDHAANDTASTSSKSSIYTTITNQSTSFNNNNNVQSNKRKWKTDAYGNVLDFTLTDARSDIMERLKTGDLYTLEECKVLLKEILKVITTDAEKDFNHLMYLSDLRNRLFFSVPIPDRPKSEHNNQNWLEPLEELPKREVRVLEEDSVMKYPKLHLHNVVYDVNASLVRIIDESLKQRKQRILMTANIIEELYQVEQYRPPVPQHQSQQHQPQVHTR